MKIARNLLIIVLIAILGSCATTVNFPVSSMVPAADGVMKIKKDKNENYLIDLNVKHLASPERLNPPRSQYVVWIVDETGVNQNIGRLAISKSRSGSLKTTTSFKPVQIFITAEDTGNVTRPGTQELFRTQRLDIK